MRLITEPYLTQLARWPQTGRHILAQFDETSVVVYQAYRPAIGRFAAKQGYFGGEFSLSRMSWIKPNFLWMMYRSGWGNKGGQEVTLAVRLQRAAFDSILAQAVHSVFIQEAYGSEAAWKKAMQKLKSVHFDMTFTDSLNSNPGTPTPGLPPLQPFTITVKASGDSVPPDQTSASFTVNTGFQGVKAPTLAEVVIGKQIYIRNAKGKWYLLEISQSESQVSSLPLSGLNPTGYNKLLNIVQKATITDHGDENLGGQNLRHFTIVFGRDSLKDFLNATDALGASSLQQQQLNLLLKGMTLQRASLDAWVDESTSYVHHIDLKFVISVDLNAIGGTATTGSTPVPPSITSIEAIIDYSNFNVPVTIQAPANATPTSDLLKIFQ